MLQHIVHVIKRLEIKFIRKHRFDYLDFFVFEIVVDAIWIL